LELASESGQIEQWRVDLHKAAEMGQQQVFQGCVACTHNFDSPDARCGPCLPQLSPAVAGFVCLLARHGKHGLLKEVAGLYSHLLDEYYGIRHAEVTTAVPIDTRTEQQLVDRLKELTGRDFMLDKRVDPSVIGGLVLRVGDIVYDRSVRTRLAALRDTVLRNGDSSKGEHSKCL
jgi:F-type H+-transporting ATPase subunit delta